MVQITFTPLVCMRCAWLMALLKHTFPGRTSCASMMTLTGWKRITRCSRTVSIYVMLRLHLQNKRMERVSFMSVRMSISHPQPSTSRLTDRISSTMVATLSEATFDKQENGYAQFYTTSHQAIPNATFDSQTDGRYQFYSSNNVYAPSATFSNQTDGSYQFHRAVDINIPAAKFNKLSNGTHMFYRDNSINIGSFEFPALSSGSIMFNAVYNFTRDEAIHVINSLPDVTAIDPNPLIDFRYTAAAGLLTDDDKQPAVDNGWDVLT